MRLLAGKLKHIQHKSFTMKHLFLPLLIAVIFACNTQTKGGAINNDTTITSTDTTSNNTATTPDNVTDTALTGSWQLQAPNADNTGTEIPTLTFNAGNNTVTGTTGCNNLSGTYTLESNHALAFGEQLIVTKKACPGYNEKAFLDNLTSTNNYRISSGVLELRNNNDVLLKFVRSSVPKDSTNHI